MDLVVENVFRKAQTEEKYTAIYGDLCEFITAKELARKGFMKVTKENRKNSEFRKRMLLKCKNDFDSILDEKAMSNVKELDFEERTRT